MRAAVLRQGRVETRTIDDPVPGPGQVLVRSLACGICASDLHYMDHPEVGADDNSGWSTYDQDVDVVMGHEYCTEIVDYGSGTERRIPVGTRVSSRPVMFAGVDGMKIIGQNPETPGAFGEYLLLDETLMKVVSSDLPSEVVCISDAIGVGWSAARRAQLGAKEIPLVIGCGAIALAVIATLKRFGAGPILAADFVPSRRELALAMGADEVIDPAAVSPYQAWRDLAAGSIEPAKNMMAAAGSSGCVVFECVGIPGVTPMVGPSVGLDGVPAALDAARDANGPARIIVVP
jgi:threonine dehydrogenase-like Zn-dependent dehydrogenase